MPLCLSFSFSSLRDNCKKLGVQQKGRDGKCVPSSGNTRTGKQRNAYKSVICPAISGFITYTSSSQRVAPGPTALTLPGNIRNSNSWPLLQDP